MYSKPRILLLPRSVFLVRHKDTQKILAMKTIEKMNTMTKAKLHRAYLERDILSFVDCPFVPSMFCSFPSEYHLCMVMEYVGGKTYTLYFYLSHYYPIIHGQFTYPQCIYQRRIITKMTKRYLVSVKISHVCPH